MIYRSKKDLWLVLIVWGAVLLPFALGLYHLVASQGNHEAGWYLLFVGVVTGGLVLWLTYPLNYELTNTSLIVRSGVMRQELLLSTIEDIRPTKNPLSAPAWSLDRLLIRYKDGNGMGVALISPEHKQEFLREIVKRSAGLQLLGDRVARG